MLFLDTLARIKDLLINNKWVEMPNSAINKELNIVRQSLNNYEATNTNFLEIADKLKNMKNIYNNKQNDDFHIRNNFNYLQNLLHSTCVDIFKNKQSLENCDKNYNTNVFGIEWSEPTNYSTGFNNPEIASTYDNLKSIYNQIKQIKEKYMPLEYLVDFLKMKLTIDRKVSKSDRRKLSRNLEYLKKKLGKLCDLYDKNDEKNALKIDIFESKKECLHFIHEHWDAEGYYLPWGGYEENCDMCKHPRYLYFKDLQIKEVVGSGSYGTVYLVQNKITKKSML
jgi:hypothetical protein